MPEVRLPVEVVCGVPVVTAPEEIDITNAAALRAALFEAGAHGRGAMVADMSGTQFCDSAGLHVLVRAHKRARAEGGELLLVVPATTVLRVFAITGIDRMIPNFSSLEDALAAHLPSGRTARGHPDDPDQKLDRAKSPRLAEARSERLPAP
jgi:anti-sigma B factor antagonist